MYDSAHDQELESGSHMFTNAYKNGDHCLVQVLLQD